MGIQLQRSGRLDCTYGAARFTIAPGDIFVWASDLPGTFASDGPHAQIAILVPRSHLPKAMSQGLHQSRPQCAQPGTGLLAIAAGQIRGVARETDGLSDDSLNRTVGAVIDLLAQAADPVDDPVAGGRSAVLSRVQQHILAHLDDAEMSPRTIAEAHGLSVRTVHLLFAGTGTSVGRWVRQQRLERCRRDLITASRTTTVTEVAFRWGFNDTAHFSRSFKQEFGVSPTAVTPRGQGRSRR